MRRAAGSFLFAALLCLLAAIPLAAQGSGSIRGRLADTTGAPVAQATIVVEGTALRGRSDEAGLYRISGVPAGTHTVRVQRIGFRAAPAQVTVRAGAEARQDFTLTSVAAGLTEVRVVTGSRRQHTAADELAVPVDILTEAELRSTGSTETSAILAQLAPSVNFPRQSVSDATEVVRPFTMRGLSPDHALVLINGKRRHHTALIHYYGAGMGAGSSGIDMNAIPSSAIERMEVLRDGAAAQYGSDAIAGVVNAVLKEGAFAPQLSFNAGQYMPDEWANDGRTFNVAGGWGFGLGRGSVGVFAEFRDRNGTNRAGADELDQIVPGDADVVGDDGSIITKNNPVAQPTHHWGDGEERALMTFVNAKLPLDDAGQYGLYAFGGYSTRAGRGYGYYRQALSERNWPQRYPQGFLPQFAPDVIDVSGAAGLRGAMSGWFYDLGATVGHNRFDFDLENTLNTSLGPCFDTPCAPGPDGNLGTADDPGIANKTAFFAGRLRLTESILSLDLSRSVQAGLHSPLSMAFGAAFRRDSYIITAGERASYLQGFHPDQYGDIAPAGSQVFPGFQPRDATDTHRDNVGAYLDLEADLLQGLLANVAARFENYSDFGAKVTGKLALRYQPSPKLTLRGAASTGFRAPSLAQSFYSATSTNFVPDAAGNPVPIEVGIFPVGSPEAQVLGAEELREETSNNFSGGLAFTPMQQLTFTADLYQIDMFDRIMLSTFLSGPDVETLLASTGSNAVAAQYFSNAIDTRTRGMDFTAAYQFPVGTGTMDLSADYNYTETEIVGEIDTPQVLRDIGVPLFDMYGEGGLLALTSERPRWRTGLTAQYQRGPLGLMGRASYYGKYTSALYGLSESSVQTYGMEGLYDAEISYTLFDMHRLTLGAKNIFDNFPDMARPENSYKMFLYPSASPFGFNGRFLYVRAEMQFGQ